jgi:hypothetical protein
MEFSIALFDGAMFRPAKRAIEFVESFSVAATPGREVFPFPSAGAAGFLLGACAAEAL